MDYARPTLADALAAQYVAGTLRGRAPRRFDTLLPSHPALQAAVHEWQSRLMPLTVVLPPQAPLARVWQAIGRRLWPAAAVAPPPDCLVGAPGVVAQPVGIGWPGRGDAGRAAGQPATGPGAGGGIAGQHLSRCRHGRHHRCQFQWRRPRPGHAPLAAGGAAGRPRVRTLVGAARGLAPVAGPDFSQRRHCAARPKVAGRRAARRHRGAVPCIGDALTSAPAYAGLLPSHRGRHTGGHHAQAAV